VRTGRHFVLVRWTRPFPRTGGALRAVEMLFAAIPKGKADAHGSMLLVRKVLRPLSHVIMRGILYKLYCLNIPQSRSHRFRHAVHPVHHRPIGRKDDRILQVCLVHQAYVGDQRSPRLRVVVATPRLIELTDVRERHTFSWERRGEFDESIDVPRKQSAH